MGMSAGRAVLFDTPFIFIFWLAESYSPGYSVVTTLRKCMKKVVEILGGKLEQTKIARLAAKGGSCERRRGRANNGESGQR